MEEQYYGYIYKTTNNINGKIYIGQHKSQILDEKYLGSGSLIKKAINRYGIENFSIEIIDWGYDKFDLNQKEIYWIAEMNSKNSDIGYNLTDGGEGVCGMTGIKFTEEHKRKISAALSKLPKGRFKGEKNPNYGKRATPEQSAHYSTIYKNSPGVKNSSRFEGHTHSEETKKRISDSVKKRRFIFNCKICGESFEAKSNRSLYCNSCKAKYKK